LAISALRNGIFHAELQMAVTFLIIEIFGCFKKENEADSVLFPVILQIPC
jgi:hypothetical protein